MKNIVYFFCIDPQIDPVANSVLNYLKNNYPLQNTGDFCDDYNILSYNKGDYSYYCVSINDVLSHNYEKYLPFVKEKFSDCEFAGIVNWHAGNNAPDHILTVHSTGDVPSGYFAPSDPVHLKAIYRSLERNRVKFNLDDYHTLIEATHWSGIPYEQSPSLIIEYKVPIYDIEIGSTRASWEDPKAIQTLAESLFDLNLEDINVTAIVGVGGKHFEECFSEIIMNTEINLVPAHILPNQWVANEDYDGPEGREKLKKCIASIKGDVKGIVFHDNLKGMYKQLCRDIAKEYNIACFKHKTLSNNEQLKQIFNG